MVAYISPYFSYLHFQRVDITGWVCTFRSWKDHSHPFICPLFMNCCCITLDDSYHSCSGPHSLDEPHTTLSLIRVFNFLLLYLPSFYKKGVGWRRLHPYSFNNFVFTQYWHNQLDFWVPTHPGGGPPMSGQDHSKKWKWVPAITVKDKIMGLHNIETGSSQALIWALSMSANGESAMCCHCITADCSHAHYLYAAWIW